MCAFQQLLEERNITSKYLQILSSVLDSHESYKGVVNLQFNPLGSIKTLLIFFVLWSGKLVCMFTVNSSAPRMPPTNGHPYF